MHSFLVDYYLSTPLHFPISNYDSSSAHMLTWKFLNKKLKTDIRNYEILHMCRVRYAEQRRASKYRDGTPFVFDTVKFLVPST